MRMTKYWWLLLHAGGLGHQPEPVDAAQALAVAFDDGLPALRTLGVDEIEHGQAERRLQLVHLAVDAGHADFVLVEDAEVLEVIERRLRLRALRTVSAPPSAVWNSLVA